MVSGTDNHPEMNEATANGGQRQRSLPLLVSLLLNALLIGVFIAHWFHEPDARRSSDYLAPGLPSIHGLARELDDDARSNLRHRFGMHRDDIRGAMRGAHESRRGVVDAMRAEPFDADALSAAFAAQRQSDMAMAAAIQSVLVQFAKDSNEADREALLRAMSREHRDRGNTRRGERATRQRMPDSESPASED